MTAVAIFEGSAMLVAVSVPLVVVGAVLGATYSAVVPPLTKLADAGVNDQVTPVLLAPPTVAVNVWFCDGSKDTEDGVSETVTGVFTVRLSDLELAPPALVALTVKVKMPAAVGVPLMMPVEDAKEIPAGSVPLVTLHVIGAVPVAARVCV
jgi:hypothetical protein